MILLDPSMNIQTRILNNILDFLADFNIVLLNYGIHSPRNESLDYL